MPRPMGRGIIRQRTDGVQFSCLLLHHYIYYYYYFYYYYFYTDQMYLLMPGTHTGQK